MKSDVISIYSDLGGREEAMTAADRFIAYNEFSGKDAMHIRLLTEELVSMVHGIMDEFKGELWFESEKSGEGRACRICLSTERRADPEQEEHLLSVATSGRNEQARGILGKIRELFRVSSQYAEDGVYANEFISANTWYSMGANSYDMPGSALGERCWSLRSYCRSLPADRSSAAEEWDELEKSIINKLADDVKVWLRSNSTEVVIEKQVK